MSLVLNIVIGAASGTTAASTLGLFFRGVIRRQANEVIQPALHNLETKLDARFDRNDRATTLAADKASKLEIELARQFGGNSGGIRQALNELGRDFSTLNGKFDQHIQEGIK